MFLTPLRRREEEEEFRRDPASFRVTTRTYEDVLALKTNAIAPTTHALVVIANATRSLRRIPPVFQIGQFMCERRSLNVGSNKIQRL